MCGDGILSKEEGAGAVLPLPAWLTQRVSVETSSVLKMMQDLRLHTVCLSASCPNIGECYGAHRAAFLLLGGVCTRSCRFCAVPKGVPENCDEEEPERLVQAIKRLRLSHVVLTSVTRDDLDDGGASAYVRCMEKIRQCCPGVTVEVLVPDFRGDGRALEQVLSAAPEVFNHNVETVPRLYPAVRPEANFSRSLSLLHRAAQIGGFIVKTGLMLGLGEREEDVLEVFEELAKAGVTALTLGQYLQPTKAHWPVAAYIPQERFRHLARIAAEMGFRQVAAGPLVRSSYHAEQLYRGGDPGRGS